MEFMKLIFALWLIVVIAGATTPKKAEKENLKYVLVFTQPATYKPCGDLAPTLAKLKKSGFPIITIEDNKTLAKFWH